LARVYLEHVWKKFGTVVAVKDLTLEVKDGEFFVLLGPSGCGKTTTLRMIAGLEDVTEGTIYIGIVLLTMFILRIAILPWCFKTMRFTHTCRCLIT